ncbi:MAG: hypothetical protein Q9180_008400, partial [Flavoplaca navasiana]
MDQENLPALKFLRKFEEVLTEESLYYLKKLPSNVWNNDPPAKAQRLSNLDDIYSHLCRPAVTNKAQLGNEDDIEVPPTTENVPPDNENTIESYPVTENSQPNN